MMRSLTFFLLALGGCNLFEEAMQKPVELQEAPETSREEQILREFFDWDFAQKKVVQFQYDIQNFDAVMNPRPRIEDVITMFGPADSVSERDLAPHGVKQTGTVYQFGKLGLVTPLKLDKVFWVIIN